MTIKEKLLNIKKGRYHHMVWQSVTIKDGKTYRKISSGSVRFANYYKVAKKPQPLDYEETIIKVNKQGEEYVQVFTTGKAPKVTYECDNNTITKEEYESNIQTNGKVGIMFSKHLEDILALD